MTFKCIEVVNKQNYRTISVKLSQLQVVMYQVQNAQT